jgi:hypothetical protein
VRELRACNIQATHLEESMRVSVSIEMKVIESRHGIWGVWKWVVANDCEFTEERIAQAE